MFSTEIPETPQEKIKKILGNMCYKCGINNPILLEIDHVYYDGKIDRYELGKKWYIKYIKNESLCKTKLQLLCKNCHWLKHKKEAFPKLQHIKIKRDGKGDYFIMREK